jgi:hypothetical protein
LIRPTAAKLRERFLPGLGAIEIVIGEREERDAKKLPRREGSEDYLLGGLPGWLVKSQLVIHSPESKIEYFNPTTAQGWQSGQRGR